MDQDTIFLYYIEEYSEWRFNDILTDLVSHKKEIDSYKNFIRAFFRIEMDFIEDYLLLSYKESFLGRLYILFLKSDAVQNYRTIWKIQEW
jgi:hypothetical protein